MSEKNPSSGAWIRVAREARGLTRAELDAMLGHKPGANQVAKWENGTTKPDANNVRLLCETLGDVAVEAHKAAGSPVGARGRPKKPAPIVVDIPTRDGRRVPRAIRSGEIESLALAIVDSDAFRGLAAEIAAQAKAAPGWVRVEERYPERSGVFVVMDGGEACAGFYRRGSWLTLGGGGECLQSDLVTHWQPLPSLPGDL
jgi:transcriptional regulator with XRE-family HTH domain